MSSTTTQTTRTTSSKSKNVFAKANSYGEGIARFKLQDVLIPAHCGKGKAKQYYQRRTMIQYAFLSAAALATFYNVDDPRARTAALGLLFPGAGFVAAGTIPSTIALVITLMSIPLILFMWFGCGGLAFPLLLWLGSDLIAVVLTRDTVLESAGTIVATACISLFAYIAWSIKVANREAEAKREQRNKFLPAAVQENYTTAQEAPKPGSREVDEETIRFVQWMLEMGLAPIDDFSRHDIIDQFQTSALRYQLYYGVYELANYQNIYCPNFHGYLSQAQRNLIEKSLTKKVMNFWKWESLLGKFTLDWDPIREDNIMVSGYILLAAALYQITTHDDRYTRPGSMEFVVTENARYKYDLRSIADAVFRNMNENPYKLFPCEPNWIYTICNLVGISGVIASDKVLGNKYGDRLKERFEDGFISEFSNADGTILPIRSELTGFTIPGLAGAISDIGPSVFFGPYLPHVAHRHWALMKHENLKWTSDNKLELENLVGADNIDPGNYKSGRGFVRAAMAGVAAEHGDEEIRKELLRQMDEEHFPVIETRTGSFKNKGLSCIGQSSALRARLSRRGDWARLLTEGPPEHCFRAPILEEVSFPDVLVAKAFSTDGVSVDLVLYNGKQPGTFDLGFKNMQPGKRYELGSQKLVAGSDGKATFSLHIDGRTTVQLRLA